MPDWREEEVVNEVTTRARNEGVGRANVARDLMPRRIARDTDPRK
jgi:hypothetical protein